MDRSVEKRSFLKHKRCERNHWLHPRLNWLLNRPCHMIVIKIMNVIIVMIVIWMVVIKIVAIDIRMIVMIKMCHICPRVPRIWSSCNYLYQIDPSFQKTHFIV